MTADTRPRRRLVGDERLHRNADPLSAPSVIEFWRWHGSELLANTLRGVFAEWLVAVDLGVAEGVREEWATWDLRTKSGITVEVKSSAYAQSWRQRRPSRPGFDIGPTKAWSPESGYEPESRRQADVYVFALLDEKDAAKVDPLDVAQWRFFVLPTRVLDAKIPLQKRLELASLLALAPIECAFGEIGAAVTQWVEPGDRDIGGR